MLKIDFYKNKRVGDKNYGKVYARAKNAKPIGVAELAEHIASHGSIYTYDVIVGVISKMATCIKELCLMGQPVKIENLCIVRAQVKTKPANDAESFELDSNIDQVRLRFTPTGSCAQKETSNDATCGYTSLAQRIKSGEIILSSRKGEYIAKDDGDDGNEPVVNP